MRLPKEVINYISSTQSLICELEENIENRDIEYIQKQINTCDRLYDIMQNKQIKEQDIK
ncbi:hypothetical protein [uncultured Clostridium sp.]|uniref:hypothetical protein n=1 Tax=uncultured Clostridium sp. TaxID=59620 RepID=UPI003217E4F9